MDGKTIGFGQVPVQNQVNALDSLHAFVDEEISFLAHFDSQIHQEITTVERAQKNALVLNDKIAAVEQLIDKRQLLYARVSNEAIKSESQINVEQCLQDLNAITKLDAGIGVALNELNNGLQKLFIGDIHDVYAQEETKRDTLKRIDVQARELVAKVYRLSDSLNGTRQSLLSIEKKLTILRTQRAQSLPQKIASGFSGVTRN